MILPTVARVLEIREKMGCSLQQAKALATLEAVQKAVEASTSVDDLKPILLMLAYHVFRRSSS